MVQPVVDKLAANHRLRRIEPRVEVAIEQPRKLIKSFKKSPLDDTECFAKTLECLETDLELMRARANAWAVGDVANLRRMTPVDQASACIAAVLPMAQILRADGYVEQLRARGHTVESP